MKKPGNIISLELLAASQWGMFTTAQAQELGIRRNQVFRMVSALRVEPICFGVYRFIAGAQPPQADLKAEWLSVFPKQKAAERLTLRPYDAVMAGRTAAVALDAGDFHASPYTFIVSRRRQTSREDIRFLHCRLSEIDVMLCDGTPTTSFERTVYDLLRLYEDPDLVDKFMEDAVRKHGHQFDVERLGSLLSPIASRFGYPIGDGISFAASLAARNATNIQLSHVAASVSQGLALLSNRAGQQSQASIDGLSTALVDLEKTLKRVSPPGLKK